MLSPWEVGRVWRFDLASGGATQLITGDPIHATAIALSSDGADLIVGTIDGSVIAVDAVDGHRKTTLPGSFDGAVKALVVDGAPGSRTIAAAGGRGSDILVWRSSRESAKKLVGHAAAVTAIGISGPMIASADEKGRVTLHRIGIVQPSMELVAGTAPLSAIAYDTPGERLAVAAEDGFIRIFEANSGRLDLEFQANQRKIRSISFSRDGRILLAAGEDHATRLWPVQPNLQTLIETARSHMPVR